MKCHVIYGVWRLALIVCWSAFLEAADEASGQGAGMLKILFVKALELGHKLRFHAAHIMIFTDD